MINFLIFFLIINIFLNQTNNNYENLLIIQSTQYIYIYDLITKEKILLINRLENNNCSIQYPPPKIENNQLLLDVHYSQNSNYYLEHYLIDLQKNYNIVRKDIFQYNDSISSLQDKYYWIKFINIQETKIVQNKKLLADYKNGEIYLIEDHRQSLIGYTSKVKSFPDITFDGKRIIFINGTEIEKINDLTKFNIFSYLFCSKKGNYLIEIGIEKKELLRCVSISKDMNLVSKSLSANNNYLLLYDRESFRYKILELNTLNTIDLDMDIQEIYWLYGRNGTIY